MAFRIPDYASEKRAVWFGPEGTDGEHATEVVLYPTGIDVRQHTKVLGYFDEPTKFDLEYPFSIQSVWVSEQDVIDGLKDLGIAEDAEFLSDVSPEHVEMALRVAAELGVEKMNHYCTESRSVGLPDVSDLECVEAVQPSLRL